MIFFHICLQIRDHFPSSYSSGAERLHDLSRGVDEEGGAVGVMNVDVIVHPEPNSPVSKKWKPTCVSTATASSSPSHVECDTPSRTDDDSKRRAEVRPSVGVIANRPDGKLAAIHGDSFVVSRFDCLGTNEKIARKNVFVSLDFLNLEIKYLKTHNFACCYFPKKKQKVCYF